MPATQSSEEFHPLCHEHHIRMKVNRKTGKSNGEVTERHLYACTAPDCLVHYDDSRGYFIPSLNGSSNKPGIVPKVRCRQDGKPMYLADVKPEKKDFRFWRCPQCGGTRTNDEDLIGGGASD